MTFSQSNLKTLTSEPDRSMQQAASGYLISPSRRMHLFGWLSWPEHTAQQQPRPAHPVLYLHNNTLPTLKEEAALSVRSL